jgi:hypothetical protein
MHGLGKTYSRKVLNYSPIAYWPLWEASGTTAECLVNPAQTGTYTGVTLGQTGIGDGKTCPLFDGTNDYVNAYSTTLRDAWNGAEGTAAGWAKVSGAGVWSDGGHRRILFAQSDANNFVQITKTNTNNQLRFWRRGGGTSEIITDTSLAATTAWFHWAITWSETADQVKTYLNGSQVGSTETSLGTYANALAVALVGADSTGPTLVWDGYQAHPALFGSALNATQIADLAAV